MNDTDMLDEYNFEKSIKNPYASRLKKSITIRLDSETISYFKDLSKDSGQCAREKRKPEVVWD